MDIPVGIAALMEEIERLGYECRLVGGCVRDHIMGRTPNDYDISSAMPAHLVKFLLPKYNVIETGLKYGTVTVMAGEIPVEVTAFRSEGEYTDHRRPDSVSFAADVGEDLKRRDFTMNAIAYSPFRGFRDDHNGINDIKNRIIRCVGTPQKRFEEDALRILRALRFASVLDFEIESETAQAMINCRDGLYHISAERIWSELKGILTGAKAPVVFNRFFDVFSVVFPGLKDKVVLCGTPADLILRLALIIENTDEKFDISSLRADRITVSSTVELLRSKKAGLREKLFLSSEQQQRLAYMDKDFRETALTSEGYTIISPETLAISGKDIISAGVSPGPKVKDLLGICMEAVVIRRVNNDVRELKEFINLIKKDR